MLELNSVPVRIGPIPFKSNSLPTVAPAIVFVCFCSRFEETFRTLYDSDGGLVWEAQMAVEEGR